MIDTFDESDAHNSSSSKGKSSDDSKFPHLKEHTPDQQKTDWSNKCLQVNRGAYSEREYRMYEEVGTSDIQIANIENQHVKKPNAGRTGR